MRSFYPSTAAARRSSVLSHLHLLSFHTFSSPNPSNDRKYSLSIKIIVVLLAFLTILPQRKSNDSKHCDVISWLWHRIVWEGRFSCLRILRHWWLLWFVCEHTEMWGVSLTSSASRSRRKTRSRRSQVRGSKHDFTTTTEGKLQLREVWQICEYVIRL